MHADIEKVLNKWIIKIHDKWIIGHLSNWWRIKIKVRYFYYDIIYFYVIFFVKFKIFSCLWLSIIFKKWKKKIF